MAIFYFFIFYLGLFVKQDQTTDIDVDCNLESIDILY